jgi:ATP-dependent DNA helicase PIF1
VFDRADSIDEDDLSGELCRAERETPTEYLYGVAGSGKTFEQVAAVKADPSYGILCASTGIAAVNLGATTIHALLKYSDTAVMQDSWVRGSLTRVLHPIAKQYRWLILDECSMYPDRQLDLLYLAVKAVNQYADVESPMGIRLIGDLAQLPPVPEATTKRVPWIFEAGCWPEFARTKRKLMTQWRQKEGDPFYDALNMIRRGQGQEGAALLARAGAKFESQLDTEFPGTTILPRNDAVGRFNQMGLERVKGEKFTVTARRWGQQRSEWGQSLKTREWGIPPATELKIGAYVMILVNASDFSFCNGDCGEIVDYHYFPTESFDMDTLDIKLTRTGRVITLHRITRGVEHNEKPNGHNFGLRISAKEDEGDYIPQPHYRSRVRRWVTGQISYFPVRLAYATTVHKSQSLTLDRVQVDVRNNFFAQPGMCYTALSRVRSLQGLRIVGQPEVLAKHCNFDPRIREWL